MTSRSEQLGELAADAALERTDFLDGAAEQLERFLESNRERIAVLGGLTLIDDEPDYLSVAPDGTFRSRSRYLDDTTGQWVSETEVIETAAELVELYNPADVYSAFADAAREAAGLPPEPTAAEDLFRTAGISPADAVPANRDIYAEAADEWAAGREGLEAPSNETEAAHRLYELSLAYVERSQRSESSLIEQFEEVAGPAMEHLGELIIVDDDDERLVLDRSGKFRAEVVPEGSEGEWKTLQAADDLVEYYDPTDVFSDLADAVAEAYPGVAPAAEPKEGEGGDDEDGEDSDDQNGSGGPNRR